VCPAEERVLGYPEAIVPDASDRIKTYHGFQPRTLVQTPSAGSHINSSTMVLVRAVDASDHVETCEWMLTVPMIDVVGELYEDLPSGTYDRELGLGSVEGEVGGPAQGLVVLVSARLGHPLDGNATVVVRTARKESSVLSSVVTEDTWWLQRPVGLGTSTVTLQVRGMVAANYVAIKLFGQMA
jgi:hypothetical protein